MPAPKEATNARDEVLPTRRDQQTNGEAHRNNSACSNLPGSPDDGAATQQGPIRHRQQHQDGSETLESDPLAHIRDDESMPSEPCPRSAPDRPRTSTLSFPAPPSPQPEERVRDTNQVYETEDDGMDASPADNSSTSAADTSSSSGSSVSSYEDQSYDDDSDVIAAGILEDFTEGVDAWFEDVHGAGREAFFGLFKRDATPQFCRPPLEIIGRNVSTTCATGVSSERTCLVVTLG